MRKFMFVLAGLALGACQPVPYGGEGETQRGEALIAETLVGYDGINEVIITSPRGWSCRGKYDRKKAAGTTTRQFPLACSNSVTGNALMSVNQVQQRATVVFTLSNGQGGRVAFGVVS